MKLVYWCMRRLYHAQGRRCSAPKSWKSRSLNPLYLSSRKRSMAQRGVPKKVSNQKRAARKERRKLSCLFWIKNKIKTLEIEQLLAILTIISLGRLMPRYSYIWFVHIVIIRQTSSIFIQHNISLVHIFMRLYWYNFKK